MEARDYGKCPECGGRGVCVERRPDGLVTCENGHKYARPVEPAPIMLDHVFQEGQVFRMCGRFFRVAQLLNRGRMVLAPFYGEVKGPVGGESQKN